MYGINLSKIQTYEIEFLRGACGMPPGKGDDKVDGLKKSDGEVHGKVGGKVD